MSEPGLIQRYLATLAADLPAEIVAELADGLDEAFSGYLGQGLCPAAAAGAAVAEFGEPGQIVAAFTAANPARHAARTLLAIGPAAGVCWGAALIAGRAWTWSIPATAGIVIAAALVIIIGLLVTAATRLSYRAAARAATAGCTGLAALDAVMLIVVVAACPVLTWPVGLACTFSATRILVTLRSLRPVLIR